MPSVDWQHDGASPGDGWILDPAGSGIYLPVGLQQTSEKSQPDGYASLDAAGRVPIDQLPASTTGGVDVEDEGSILGAATTLNLTGGGVTATVAGGVATINVPGGSGSSVVAMTRATLSAPKTTTGGALPWDAATTNDLDVWAPGSPSRFTITAAGVYLVGGSLVLNTNTYTGRWLVQVTKNGAALPGSRNELWAPSTTGFPAGHASAPDVAAAGDFYELSLYCGGASIDINSTPSGFWIVRLA